MQGLPAPYTAVCLIPWHISRRICVAGTMYNAVYRCRDAAAAVDDIDHLHLKSSRDGRRIKVRRKPSHGARLALPYCGVRVSLPVVRCAICRHDSNDALFNPLHLAGCALDQAQHGMTVSVVTHATVPFSGSAASVKSHLAAQNAHAPPPALSCRHTQGTQKGDHKYALLRRGRPIRAHASSLFLHSVFFFSCFHSCLRQRHRC